MAQLLYVWPDTRRKSPRASGTNNGNGKAQSIALERQEARWNILLNIIVMLFFNTKHGTQKIWKKKYRIEGVEWNNWAEPSQSAA